MSRAAFLARLVLCLMACALAHAATPVPDLKSRVTDLTATLSDGERQHLEQELAEFEAEKGAQIAVLIVASTGEETVEQYAIRVAEAWKLGRKGVDDGALLLVAKDDRRVRIEVGYGLEGGLSDAISKGIVEEIIVPHFRNGHFYSGIAAGIERMQGVIRGEQLPKSGDNPRSGRAWNGVFGLFAVLWLIIGSVLGSLVGRLYAGALSFGLMAAIVWWSPIAGAFLLILLVVGILAAFAGGPRSGGGMSAGATGWAPGALGGGTGSFGSGGGGFSGGGGGFGGGGASGSW